MPLRILLEKPSLPLKVGSEFGPAVDKRGGGNAPQFGRLNLVQTASGSPSFATEFTPSDLTEQDMDRKREKPDDPDDKLDISLIPKGDARAWAAAIC